MSCFFRCGLCLDVDKPQDDPWSAYEKRGSISTPFKKLVQVVLLLSYFTWKEAINMIKYHLKCYGIAYESHRKRKVAFIKVAFINE